MLKGTERLCMKGGGNEGYGGGVWAGRGEERRRSLK